MATFLNSDSVRGISKEIGISVKVDDLLYYYNKNVARESVYWGVEMDPVVRKGPSPVHLRPQCTYFAYGRVLGKRGGVVDEQYFF